VPGVATVGMPDSPAPADLRAEDATTPLAVGVDRPRLSWRFDGPEPRVQAGYRVLVATTPDRLTPGDADVWDSGAVAARHQRVAYGGPALDPCERYHWAVRAWSDGGDAPAGEPAGAPGPWARSWFETGPESFDAAWLADPAADDGLDGGEASPAPYFRREFEVDAPEQIERARLYLCTAGYHDPHLNGERLDAVLDPGASDYEERVLSAAFDVTDRIEPENALGVALGRARFADPTVDTWNWHEAPWHEDGPRFLARLDLHREDGSVRRLRTDESWHLGHGGTRFDSIFEGERFDAREEPEGWTTAGFDDDGWDDPAVVDGPDGEPAPQTCPPVCVVRSFAPAGVERVDEDTDVFDVGEMVAGWATLSVDAPPGTELRITYGERRREDGTVEPRDVYRGEHVRPFVEGRLQTDTYVCAGGSESEKWTPRFSYRGFRYVQVRGVPEPPSVEDLTVRVAHTDVHAGGADGSAPGVGGSRDGAGPAPGTTGPSAGEAAAAGAGTGFTCSEPLIERIRGNCRRALVNNFHSIPTDTPTFEKNGWTGDALVSAEAALYEFDAVRFYRKWLDDVADAQLPSGEIPVIAPTSDWGYSEGGQFAESGTGGRLTPVWDTAYVSIPWWLYRYCGDRATLARHYDGMVALFEFIADRAGGDIIHTGHGDHLAPEHDRDETPPEGPGICSTAYYYGMAETLGRAAAELGREADADRFDRRRKEIAAAFERAFFDADCGVYRTSPDDGYRQTSNALPLSFGLVPDSHLEDVLAGLVENVREVHDGHLDTGVVGTKHLFRTLTDHGHVDLAYEAATRRTYPSYGQWIEWGATALYEWWEAHSRSRDHHMYASVDDWFHGRLAGVTPATPGFETARVRPYPPADLDAAATTVETPRGQVRAGWERTGDGLRLDVGVPPNARAQVHLPGSPDAAEVIDAPAGAEAAPGGTVGGRPAYAVGTGEWSFAVVDPEPYPGRD